MPQVAFDGIFLSAVIRELKVLEGGRLDKIEQPEKDALILTVRSGGQNHRLLMSADPSHARLHLTNEKPQNPPVPPAFCMLLRKRLLGGRILSVAQPAGDRIAVITLESADELGDITQKRMILEIMGRHSNLIVTDAGGRVLDCIRHVSFDVSRVRQMLPGLTYVSPPGEARKDPADITEEGLLALLSQSALPLPKALQAAINGLSPQSAQEVCLLAGYTAPYPTPENLGDEGLALCCRHMAPFFARLRQGDYAPRSVKVGDRFDVLPFPYQSVVGEETEMTANEAAEKMFAARDRESRRAQRSASLRQSLTTLLERNGRKQQVLQETLLACRDMKQVQKLGELVTGQLWKIPSGAARAELEDWYTGETVTVELDPRLTPAENGQRLFKRYQKLKTASVAAKEQLEQAREEERYLESLLESLHLCDRTEEMAEIRKEMEEAGYLKAAKGRQKTPPSRPLSFRLPSGREVLVGRNNVQNDKLTLRTAFGTDLWLHTKDIPGSHVILRTDNKEIPQEDVYLAAVLAAYHSKARGSSNVPVDAALAKHVHKPAGAKPGFVIYDHQNTLYVTPDEEALAKLGLEA